MGRPPKWNFDDHKDTLRRLWVDEKLTMPQLRDYMKLHHQFAPVPGAYFKKFTEWDFPRKISPILKDENLIARVKELWSQNYGSDEILRITREEGFDVDHRNITRIRARFGLILKLPGGYGNPKRTLARKHREKIKQKTSQSQSQSRSVSAEREQEEDEDEDGSGSSSNSDGDSSDSGGEGEDGPEEIEQQLQQVQEHNSSLNNAPSGGYGGPYHSNTATGTYHDHWNTVSNQPYRGGMRQWDNSYPLGYAPPVPPTLTESTSGWQHQQQAAPFQRQPEQQHQQHQEQQQSEPRQTSSQPPDEAALAAKREQRKRQVEAEAEELWRTKKRRRHTKQYGFLPPDPAGPPRYPSETTLTEAKEILQLDPEAYKGIREKFYNICMSHGVIKKTLIGPERWTQFKDQLIRESLHLRAAMWDQENMEQKKLAVEIICNDITKRVRITQSKISVAEAKRILGLDPDKGREVRAELYNILAVERFGPVLEEGIERFRALRRRWIDANDILKEAWTNEEDPEHARKVKAVIALGRDAERRYHADVHKRGIDPLRPRSPTPEPTKPPKPPKEPRPPKPPKVPKKRGRPKRVVPSVEVPEGDAVTQVAGPASEPGMNQGQDNAIAGAASVSGTPAAVGAAPAAVHAGAPITAPAVPGALPTASPAPVRAPQSVNTQRSLQNPAPAQLQFTIETPQGATDPNLVPGLTLPNPAKKRRGRPPKQAQAPTHTQVHFAPPVDAVPSPEADDQTLMDSQLGYGDDYVPDDTPEPYVDNEAQEMPSQVPVQQQEHQQQQTTPAPDAGNQSQAASVGPLTLKQAQEKWLKEQALRRQQEEAAQQAAARPTTRARSQQVQSQQAQNPQAQHQQQFRLYSHAQQPGQPQMATSAQQHHQQFQVATPAQPQPGPLVATLGQLYQQPQMAVQQQQPPMPPPAQPQQQLQMATPIQQPQRPQPQAPMVAAVPSAVPSAPPPAPAPLTKGTFPAYFRLHNAIRGLFPGMKPQWIHLLTSRSYRDLKEAAVVKTPGAMCYKIEGIVKDGNGGELPLPVTDDMELETYLEHIEGNGGGAPMFNVHLFPGGI
ncbi:hypothetical protein B0T21DRAFT_9745 [Apiosordaria backusii]|uniref:Clr5 domain-containing protein n=1 Tax=Apiosordaria backusii TaxID=314023 RepID=A0AA40EY84_9PEZI|nr:hypothetical protein B0T21DRAFT_9745 [Apiosordaria backusii]